MTTSRSPVLVLVHAYPMGAAMWRPQMDAAPDWRIVAPEMPGFGGRALLPERSMDAYARDLLSTLDGMGIERAVFCGLSMGGYAIFGVLRQAPQRVAGLILADTRTSIDDAQRRAARLRSIELVRRSGPPAIADEMLPSILGATTHARRPDVAAQVRALIESQPAETIAAALEAMMNRPDSADVLSRVTVPTAIIVGEEDTVTPLSDAEHMHRLVRGSALVTIREAGHMANLEAPDAFNHAMRTFLAGVPLPA
jgi:pimeloyl-ACP methyl ester carboxylesterase